MRRPRRQPTAPSSSSTAAHGSGLDQDDLHWALTEGAVIPEGEIKRIEVLDRFSFVELAEDQAALALERLDGTKLKGKQIRVEYAKS